VLPGSRSVEKLVNFKNKFKNKKKDNVTYTHINIIAYLHIYKMVFFCLFDQHKSDRHKSDRHKSDRHKSDRHKSDRHKSGHNIRL
jgi:hypothetical protein